MKLLHLLSATALTSVSLAVPGVAWASAPAPAAPQDQNAASCPPGTTGPTCNNENPDDNGDAIVITGSRIAVPNSTSIIPVTTISAQELQQTGRVSTGDVLNDLPALQSTFSQSNSTRFLGTAGLNLLDLRGLGTQRTLVLVNGRRHVGADILNNAVSPDINTFPTDLIERVDVVTGGDSAVYGSDAIAGVVNFVLRDHFDGVQVHAQGTISQYGDAGSYYASLLAGHNFAGGRGNIAVDLEYARQNQYFAAGRRNFAENDGFVTVDTDSAGLGGGNISLNSDGNPDAIFFRDIRSATIAASGIVSVRAGNGNGSCGTGTNGLAFACNYIFDSVGNLVPETGSRQGLGSGTASPSNSIFVGGNGDTRREGQLLQLAPQLDRYSANLIGHFEISPAFVPFIEAKYVRTDSFGTGSSGPAFTTGSTFVNSANSLERPRLDNPFLSPAARATLTTAFTNSVNAGFNPITGAAYTGTPAQIAAAQATALAAIADGSQRFILRKNLLDLGVRSESARRETYRVVGGIRGEFNGDWHYELSANYGEFDERTRVNGNINSQRLLLALDSGRNAAGQIVCRSQINPANAAGAVAATGDPNNLIAADIAACQPLNPFGTNVASDAARNYILQNTTSVGRITQFDVTGFVNGDTSGFFNLPGGPVGFAIGGEYRRETNRFREDPLVEAGYTFYNAIAAFNPPSFEVKEAYGELRLPILRDLPFAHELTVSGAGRVSDYKGSAGTVYTYNAGVDWSPIRDIRFRANYARAVRAPNLVELYSPQSQNFAPGFVDPCAANSIATGTQYRAANCAAAGIPANYNFQYQQSLLITQGGNPGLSSEKSDSYTYGVVLQPRFIPGLTLAIDYYNIRVNNVIVTLDAQTIANQCYDSPSLNNQFCGLFTRNGSATAATGEEPFRILEGSLLASSVNYASLKTRGIDVDLQYQHRFGGVNLSSHIVYTHQLQNDSFTDPTDPTFGDTIVGELGSPRDAANWSVNADFGTIFTNFQVRYLSQMYVGAAENHITFEGRPPQNADDFDTFQYPDVFYFDARVGFNINRGSSFYFGIDNITDRLPPLGSTGIGGGSAIYDNFGRRFYAGITANF